MLEVTSEVMRSGSSKRQIRISGRIAPLRDLLAKDGNDALDLVTDYMMGVSTEALPTDRTVLWIVKPNSSN